MVLFWTVRTTSQATTTVSGVVRGAGEGADEYSVGGGRHAPHAMPHAAYACSPSSP